ncbi:MAG: response regulator [Gammaproteobacteria bacterium]|nr:response regulator [Gammaproteobacteria bacterium]
MSTSDIASLSILLVEPSVTQRRIIKEQIMAMGAVEIHDTETGDEALGMLRSLQPNLMISAMYLPDMLGTDLLARINTEPSFDKTAFILISSETSIKALEPIKQGGAISILPKPFTIEALSYALKASVDYFIPTPVDSDTFDTRELELLVVDDSTMSRKQIKRILTNMGITNIHEAKDGQQAIEMIKTNFYDLLVTDYNMPNIDGQALVNFIRNKSNQSSLPILMITSEKDQGRLKAIQQAGVSALCDKPFEPQTIRTMIESIYA